VNIRYGDKSNILTCIETEASGNKVLSLSKTLSFSCINFGSKICRRQKCNKDIKYIEFSSRPLFPTYFKTLYNV